MLSTYLQTVGMTVTTCQEFSKSGTGHGVTHCLQLGCRSLLLPDQLSLTLPTWSLMMCCPCKLGVKVLHWCCFLN